MRNMSRLCRKVCFPNIIVGKRDGTGCVCADGNLILRGEKHQPDLKFTVTLHVIELRAENDVRSQIAVGKLKIFKNRKIVYISKMLLLITYVAMPRYPIHTYIIL